MFVVCLKSYISESHIHIFYQTTEGISIISVTIGRIDIRYEMIDINRADMEFFIILPRAKISKLPASAFFLEILAYLMQKLDHIKPSNQGQMAFKMPICGNNATYCGILSQNLIIQSSFEGFPKSFHNLTEFFREQCSRARAKFHVCNRVTWHITI